MRKLQEVDIILILLEYLKYPLFFITSPTRCKECGKCRTWGMDRGGGGGLLDGARTKEIRRKVDSLFDLLFFCCWKDYFKLKMCRLCK